MIQCDSLRCVNKRTLPEKGNVMIVLGRTKKCDDSLIEYTTNHRIVQRNPFESR